MLKIWITPLRRLEDALTAAEQMCPQILTARSSANEQVMRQRLTAYLNLAALFGEPLPLIYWEASGKPHFCGDRTEFSLSHTQTGAAAVLSDRSIGIDLQRVKKVRPTLIQRVCSDREQKILSASHQVDVDFIRLWSAKEAVSKAIGCGLGKLSPQAIEVFLHEKIAVAGNQQFRLEEPKSELPQTVCVVAQSIEK